MKTHRVILLQRVLRLQQPIFNFFLVSPFWKNKTLSLVSKRAAASNKRRDAGDKKRDLDPQMISYLETLQREYILHARLSAGPRLVLSREVRKEIYNLHKSDPVGWPPDRISLKYGVRKQRVLNIIKCGEEEEKTDPSELAPEEEVKEVYDALGRLFGVVDRPFERNQLPSIESTETVLRLVDGDTNQAELVKYVKVGKQPRWKAPRSELPQLPPPNTAFQPGALIASPGKYDRPRKSLIYVYFKDSRAHRKLLDSEARFIWKVDKDGTFRVADWQFRRDKLKNFRNRKLKEFRIKKEMALRTDSFEEEIKWVEEIEKQKEREDPDRKSVV